MTKPYENIHSYGSSTFWIPAKAIKGVYESGKYKKQSVYFDTLKFGTYIIDSDYYVFLGKDSNYAYFAEEFSSLGGLKTLQLNKEECKNIIYHLKWDEYLIDDYKDVRKEFGLINA